MAKSSIQVLARYISEKRGVPQRDAEHFVKSFFEIISETLQSGESLVKIKGFGTFKIVDVKDRESVDVNTGERIVIEGRSKISFIPDNVMKELVNKPFSQFETVVVNDGVNFEEEEVKEEGVQEVQGVQGVQGVQEVQGVQGVQGVQEVKEEVKEEVAKEEEAKEEEVKEEEVKEEEVKEEGVQEVQGVQGVQGVQEVQGVQGVQGVQEVKEEVKEEVAKEEEAKEEEVKEEEVKEEEVKEEVVEEVKEEEVKEEVEEEELSSVEVTETPSKTPWWILSLILTALIMFLLGYYAGNRGALSSFFMKMATPAPQKVVVTDTIAKIDTVAKKDTVVKKDTVAKKDIVAKKDTVVKATVVKATVVKEPAKPLSPALAQAHNIVNTGAYIIEGTSETVVVKKGQTLSRISRTYLGEGMEAYVQVLNGVTEVKEGMSVKIPKLKVKKKKKR